MFSNLMYHLRALLQRNSIEAELHAELRAHIEQQEEKDVQAGMSPEDAARCERLEFGSIERVKEECRDSRGVRLISALAKTSVMASAGSDAIRVSRALPFLSLPSASVP